MTDVIRIGSRKSRLAVRQAEMCAEALRASAPEDREVQLLTFQTTGDSYLAGSLSDIGNKGLFTKEIEEALLRDDIDIAVHSMKDVATVLPEGLIIPAMLPRHDVRDVLLSHQADALANLPRGACVGTSSLRRAVQVQHIRPDLEVVPYRGNLERRMAKLDAGEVDATLLAAAGLDRLGYTPAHATRLSMEEMLPAVSQGAIGLQCRQSDEETLGLLASLNHPATLEAVTLERRFLWHLDGSCRTPIAGYATIDGDTITLEGSLGALDGSWLRRGIRSGPRLAWEQVAAELAEALCSGRDP